MFPVQFGTTYLSPKPLGSAEAFRQLEHWARMKRHQSVPVAAKRVMLEDVWAPNHKHEFAILTDEGKDGALTTHERLRQLYEKTPAGADDAAAIKKLIKRLEKKLARSLAKPEYIPEDF